LPNSLKRPRQSFVAHFIEWLLGPIVFLWLATAALSIFMVSRAVDESFDTRLEDLAKAAATHLAPPAVSATPLQLTSAVDALVHSERFEDGFVALRGANGRIFAGETEMPPTIGPTDASGSSIYSGVIGDVAVRVASVRVPISDPGHEPVNVEVAETLGRRHALKSSLIAESFVPQLVLLGGTFLLVLYGLAYVIAPMRRLKTAIDARDSRDLTPIDPTQAPDELQPLIASINELLRRVEGNFEVQRRFIADAAHQLRTPLAGLKSQTELALAESDQATIRAALQRLAGGTDRAIHLANRLLALARAGTVHAPAQVPVAVNPIARSVVADFVPLALERGIDLGLDIADEDDSVILRADLLLLEQLLSNLVDNALRYTPTGGTVTVSVQSRRNRTTILEVTDSGPGVPAEERERVFDPFFRGADAPAGGTGLGLAIVRAIADAHGAHVVIENATVEGGARVRVVFESAGRWV
jgi:two-component system sensor histidine kinase TctE